MNPLVAVLLKNWFLCGIVLFILLAWADPEIGKKECSKLTCFLNFCLRKKPKNLNFSKKFG